MAWGALKSARDSAKRVRDAFSAAKSRTGGEGRLVALSAGGFLLAFVLLAGLAPFLMQAPAVVSSIVGFVLVTLVLVATGLGALALWRIVRVGLVAETQPKSIYSQSAVEVALSDAGDAGLRGPIPHIAEEAVTGEIRGFRVAIIFANQTTYAVVRLKEPSVMTLLVAPMDQPWPYAYAKQPALMPIASPEGLKVSAWASDRRAGMALLDQLSPALALSGTAGELPYVSMRGRALVMMWKSGDIGTASLICGEVVKSLGKNITPSASNPS